MLVPNPPNTSGWLIIFLVLIVFSLHLLQKVVRPLVFPCVRGVFCCRDKKQSLPVFPTWVPRGWEGWTGNWEVSASERDRQEQLSKEEILSDLEEDKSLSVPWQVAVPQRRIALWCIQGGWTHTIKFLISKKLLLSRCGPEALDCLTSGGWNKDVAVHITTMDCRVMICLHALVIVNFFPIYMNLGKVRGGPPSDWDKISYPCWMWAVTLYFI